MPTNGQLRRQHYFGYYTTWAYINDVWWLLVQDEVQVDVQSS